MHKTIALNTLYQLLARAITAAVSLTITIAISRSLGVFDFGELVKIISFVSLFYMPLDFGINAIALRLFHAKPAQIGPIASNLITLRLAISLFLVIFTIVIAFFLPGTADQGFTPLVKLGIYLLSFNTIFLGLAKSFHALFQHFLRYQNIVFSQLAQGAVMLTAVYFTITATKSILTITSAYVLSGLVGALTLWFLARRLTSFSLSVISLPTWKMLLLPALPLGLTIILSTLNSRIDLFVLSLTRTTMEVGHYGLAKRIFELFLVVPIFFSNSLYPLLVKQSAPPKLLRFSLLWMVLASVAALVFIYFSAPAVTLIKPDFAASVSYLRLLGLTLPLFFVTAPLMWALIARHQEASLIYIYSFSLLINIVVNLTFTSAYGPISAIIALGLSELTALFLILIKLLTPKSRA